MTLLPHAVQLGMRILCGTGHAHEIDMIELCENGLAYRFSFTDGRWSEYALDQRVTIVDGETAST